MKGGRWNKRKTGWPLYSNAAPQQEAYCIFRTNCVWTKLYTIPGESHPSIPIYLNANCSAGTGPTKKSLIWNLLMGTSECNLWPNHLWQNAVWLITFRGKKLCHDNPDWLMSPQEHAQAQTLHYSELHPVPNDTLKLCGAHPNLCLQKCASRRKARNGTPYGLVDFTGIPRNTSL